MKQSLIIAALLICCMFSHATIFGPSSVPDQLLFVHNTSYACSTDVNPYDVTTLNCDMYYADGINTFWAVAYTAMDIGMLDPILFGGCFFATLTPTPITGIHFEYAGTPGLSSAMEDFYIPNASNPDVVIADDASGTVVGPSGSYTVGVVYNHTNGMDVEICTFNTTDLFNGSSSPNISGPSMGVQLNTPGRIARDPHIDMFAENYNGNDQALFKYIATWTEHAAGVDYIMVAIGDINNPASFTRYQISNDGIAPDVAAQGLKNCLLCGSATDYAYVTYIEPSSGDLKLAELDITGTTLNSTNITTLSINGTDHSVLEAPRIEARVYANPNDGLANYCVAAALVPFGGSNYNVYNFTDIAAPDIFQGTTGDDFWSPAVTGVGAQVDPSPSSHVGESSFITAAYSSHTVTTNVQPGVFASHISMSTGIRTTGHEQANSTALLQAVISSAHIPTAIATSAKSGHQILTVWYNGWDQGNFIGEMRFKLGTDAWAYKPAVLKSPVTQKREISPNPTTDNLNVSGITNAQYYVYDLLGRKIINGAINKENNIIPTGNLYPGMYILNIIENGQMEKMKFIKN